MHRLTISFFISLLLPLFPLAAQNANPLLEMIGKEYGDYFDRYEALNDSLFEVDSLSRAELVRLFTEAATADPSGEWDLNRQLTEGHVRFYQSRNGGYTPSADYTAESFADDLLRIARQAREKGFEFIRLRALFNAATVYRIFAHDYEQAFACYLEAAVGLDTLSQRKFPWKLYMYREIADFYTSFHEYTDAARFYRKIAEDPDATYKNHHHIYPALSGLAECYRHTKQYDRSDSCLLRILKLSASIEEDRYVWEGIAEGNIGYNYYLRGDMDKALSWMEPALSKMKRPNDDPYTSLLAANIANIYLCRKDVENGGKYLAIALRYHYRSLIPEKDSRLLEVMAHYYTLHGDYSKAAAYLDSTLRAKEREQEAFSGLVLRRVEQQLRTADRRLHERQLDAEKLRSTFYKRTAFGISGASAVILALLLLFGIYYRRTRQAYHELVLRSQQWAGIETSETNWKAQDEFVSDKLTTEEAASHETVPAEPTESASENILFPTATPISADKTDDMHPEETLTSEADRLIMERVEKVVVHDCFYKRADLTLDMLVLHTGLNRSYLSGALNRCVGKNFNAYINEFRVKEAVRLMSDPTHANDILEVIALESGFNDRSNFYRTFKKLTGLSPTHFRKNLNMK